MSKEQIIRFLPTAVLLLPLISAVLILLFTKRYRQLSAGLSTGAVAIGLGISIFLFATQGVEKTEAGSDPKFTWLSIGLVENDSPLPTAVGQESFAIDIQTLNDPMSRLMLLIVTFIGTLVHVFSLVYMRKRQGFSRYFGALSFFVFSMLGIVLSSNLVMMFIFWELVGVSSYLLISHWFEKPAAADAGKKAFVTNRIGDVGFLLGIILIWQQTSSVNIAYINSVEISTLAGLLIFCGAIGKSAQFPLHVWLPDAMEGPTPFPPSSTRQRWWRPACTCCAECSPFSRM